MQTKYVLFITFVLLYSCRSQDVNKPKLNNEIISIISCPEDGECQLSIIPNQSVVFQKDEFDNGYVELVKSDAHLIKFEYQRHTIPNTVDGDYIERIYLELPSDPKALLLKDKDLQKINLLFERICYCKGQTGFHKINQGSLSLKPFKHNNYHLKLRFTMSAVPHIITEIDQIFQLK